ncbi:MAG: hypothetical protein JWP84_3872 [Tardiphaga sp.]|nr:hypothetical protein [Tardiphaga sp.]
MYGLQVGIVGTEGVIDIEDTHRDLVMATMREIAAERALVANGGVRDI